jgi:hypothetical protein
VYLHLVSSSANALDGKVVVDGIDLDGDGAVIRLERGESRRTGTAKWIDHQAAPAVAKM